MINFEATLKALSERGVNFVVIGGYAATLHGSAYLRDGADRSAIVLAPVQRRQQLCST
jgi:hypothetical protein